MRLESLAINASPNGLFDQAFGGLREENAKSYFQKRVRYILPIPPKSPDTHLATNASQYYFALTLINSINDRLNRVEAIRSSLIRFGSGYESGQTPNLSLPVRPAMAPTLVINGRSLMINKPGMGVMQLGPAYMRSSRLEVERLSTLLHEARHSDCKVSGKFSKQYTQFNERLDSLVAKNEQRLLQEASRPPNPELVDFLTQTENDGATLANEANSLITNFTAESQCGMAHVDCPNTIADVSMRGAQGACDDLAWGAYAVGAAFLQGVAKGCESCTAIEKERARAAAADSLNRLVDLSILERNPRRGLDQEPSGLSIGD